MDNRRYYLLTLLPPLPAPGEPLPITLSEVLERLRQQGGRDLERLTDAMEAETGLRAALDEWVTNPPGSRSVPAALPPSLAALFDEADVAGAGAGAVAWIDAVWQAWFDLMAGVGRGIGSRLLPRWAEWESALRRRLARARVPHDEGRADEPSEARADGFDLDAVLTAWDSTRERGRAGLGIAAAMEAEEILERARLEFLEREAPRYTFTMDELAAYLLQLRLLDRQQRRDPAEGRNLLRQVAAL